MENDRFQLNLFRGICVALALCLLYFIFFNEKPERETVRVVEDTKKVDSLATEISKLTLTIKSKDDSLRITSSWSQDLYKTRTVYITKPDGTAVTIAETEQKKDSKTEEQIRVVKEKEIVKDTIYMNQVSVQKEEKRLEYEKSTEYRKNRELWIKGGLDIDKNLVYDIGASATLIRLGSLSGGLHIGIDQRKSPYGGASLRFEF